MLVEFNTKWFAPSPEVKKDKIQSISGRRYNTGVHEIPDELKDYLPSDAKILKEMPKEEPKREEVQNLRDLDLLRASGDLVADKVEEAKKTELKIKQDRMAKAREAKGAKKGNKTVE